MGSVGDAYDNAMAASFFATLKCELIDRCRFHTRAEATMAVFGYIEGWYNLEDAGTRPSVTSRRRASSANARLESSR